MTREVHFKLRTVVITGIVAVIVAFGIGYRARQFMANRLANIDLSSLNEVESTLKSKYDGSLSNTALLDGAKEGMVAAAGDPYTVYLNAAAAKSLNDDLNGTLQGIGAEIGIRNNHLTVISPVPGTPAAKAGLMTGDVIEKINGTDPSGLSLDDAVAEIRGKQGTKVTLSISRNNGTPYNVTITRDTINVPDVNWSMKSGIGYIQITQFGPDTGAKVDQAATDLTNQGAKKFVLDLRDDPGGYLDQAVKVASEFVSSKLVVEERRGSTSIDKQYATSGGKLVGMPVDVLINGGSASASEIVAGALHDDINAQLVGEKSFGKGSVQEILPLSGGSSLKVTVAHWYTPAGVNINKEGIKPTVKVPLTQANMDAGQDPQLDKAIQLLQ